MSFTIRNIIPIVIPISSITPKIINQNVNCIFDVIGSKDSTFVDDNNNGIFILYFLSLRGIL